MLFAIRHIGQHCLKAKSWADVVDDEIQDCTVMNGVSYFSHHFSSSLCNSHNQIGDTTIVMS